MGRPLHDDLDRGQPCEGREDGEGTGLIRVPDCAKGAEDDALGGRGQFLGKSGEGTTGLMQVVIGILGTRSSSWALAILWQYSEKMLAVQHIQRVISSGNLSHLDE